MCSGIVLLFHYLGLSQPFLGYPWQKIESKSGAVIKMPLALWRKWFVGSFLETF